jgi:hypothetical protein
VKLWHLYVAPTISAHSAVALRKGAAAYKQCAAAAGNDLDERGQPLCRRPWQISTGLTAAQRLLSKFAAVPCGSISHIGRVGPNDRDVSTANVRASALNASFVAVADAHRPRRGGRPTPLFSVRSNAAAPARRY